MDESIDLAGLRSAAAAGRIQWRKHSLERMLERGIDRAQVRSALLNGELIEVYSGNRPYPSGLILYTGGPALHVVAAYDPQGRICHVITAYWPDLDRFEPDFRTRRQGE